MPLAENAMPVVPGHVPAELVRNIGLIVSEQYLADPFRYLAGLHSDHPPIFYDTSSSMGPCWMIIKHDLAFRALRDTEHFIIDHAEAFPRDPDKYFKLIPLESHPPDHRKYRLILDSLLSPKGVLKLEHDIRLLANQLIDRFIAKGECEFTADFARRLPVSVFLNLMGLPLSMLDQFVTWVVSLIQLPDPAHAKQVMADIENYLLSVIADKRACPDDGAISQIAHARIDGEALPERDVLGYAFFLFVAGIDTVYSSFNSIWAWMARNPDRVREMSADSENINNQVEELYRAFGSSFSGRTVSKDLKLGGVTMKAGDRLMGFIPACNYDPDIYPDSSEIRFDRPRKPLLTFGGGIHSCMGAHLARLELKVALQEWFRRIPEFTIKSGAEITYVPNAVVGPIKVPLVW